MDLVIMHRHETRRVECRMLPPCRIRAFLPMMMCCGINFKYFFEQKYVRATHGTAVT